MGDGIIQSGNGIGKESGRGAAMVFLRVMSKFPQILSGRKPFLGLAESNSYNEIYINGKQIFAGITKGKREIKVPQNTWKSGDKSACRQDEQGNRTRMVRTRFSRFGG